MSLFTHDTAGTTAQAWRSHPRYDRMNELDLPSLHQAVHGERLRRLVVVAAHPDDETLGAAGLMRRASDAGVEVVLVLATAGERSHPHSSTTSPSELRATRLSEVVTALAQVAPTAAMRHLDVPDGDVASATDRIVTTLVDLLGDARENVVVAPWRQDGHPDHEACGRAAAVAAHRTGALLLEYPVWWWHWGHPDEAPWDDLVAVVLAPHEAAAKASAIAAHRSQVRPLSDAPGDETLLGADFLDHFSGDREVFVRPDPRLATEDGSGPAAPGSTDPALDDLHRHHRDPWGTTTRWYEQRKRDLTLAMLPRPTFSHGLELGCSVGTLAADLAQRCDRLLAVDESAHAIEIARVALAGLPQVTLERRRIPEEWPTAEFDLVVVSEVAYFLSPYALDQLVERIRACRTTDGVVLLCHWTHPVLGWVLDGPEVNLRLLDGLGLPVLATYRDRDVEIIVLGPESSTPEPSR